MDESTKIEPYYQTQAKRLVDCLFDKGLLSESLSRDGMNLIEELLGFFLQGAAESAGRVAVLTKKYKTTARDQQEGEDRPRHEEEMRWIARAKEAENGVIVLADKLKKLTPWHKDVVKFLRDNYCVDVGFASHLLNKAFELGMAEPDFGPGKIILGDEI